MRLSAAPDPCKYGAMHRYAHIGPGREPHAGQDRIVPHSLPRARFRRTLVTQCSGRFRAVYPLRNAPAVGMGGRAQTIRLRAYRTRSPIPVPVRQAGPALQERHPCQDCVKAFSAAMHCAAAGRMLSGQLRHFRAPTTSCPVRPRQH